MPRTRDTLALALVALAAGCGGGGGDGGGNGGLTDNAAYDAAFDICAGGVQATADAYALEPNKEAVAQVVVEQVSGGSPKDEMAARQGCLDALNKAEAG
jgi:hypothetical protein